MNQRFEQPSRPPITETVKKLGKKERRWPVLKLFFGLFLIMGLPATAAPTGGAIAEPEETKL
jgi:hypothetical protein